jgi:tetratricopeptide (TPR) repeat protein
MINKKTGGLILYALGLVLTLSLVPVAKTFAQYEEYEKGQKLKYLDLGIKQYENGLYKEADESFRQVLENLKVLPAEICFYFGVNSFYLEKYKQSINWLNKYIALKGTSGQFFDECTTYLEKAQEKYLMASTVTQNEVYDPGEAVDYTVMPKIDCGPLGKVVCPVCKGQTVIIKRGSMSLEYKSCPYCDNHGNLSCDNYNLLINGELKPKSERTLN